MLRTGFGTCLEELNSTYPSIGEMVSDYAIARESIRKILEGTPKQGGDPKHAARGIMKVQALNHQAA